MSPFALHILGPWDEVALHCLGGRELRGIRNAVANRVAEEDFLPLHLVPEVGVSGKSLLVTQLVDVLQELELSEVLDGGHANFGHPFAQDFVLPVALNVVAGRLRSAT